MAVFWLAVLATLPLPPAGAQALRGLPDPVAQVFVSRKLPAESFSAWVQAVGAPTPAVSFNADTPRNPASVIKLLTTWAALQALGPTYRWKTEAYFDGRLVDGTCGSRGCATSPATSSSTTPGSPARRPTPAPSTASPTATTTPCRTRCWSTSRR
jgi:D-alanyl-D-alanine carboxypeptidase